MTGSIIPLRKKETLGTTGILLRCNLSAMSEKSSPTESWRTAAEETAAYDRWLRAKVQSSIDDERPGIAHDDVMVEIEAIIQLAESRSAANRS